ncbi:hypothetical protein R6Q59_013666 [Mikania micrantha]
MTNLTFGDKHNLCAYLDPTTRNVKDFRPMIEFLRRSRIYYAISNLCQINRSHIQSFWESARLISVDEEYVIEANVLGQAIRITEADIRRVLQFGGEPAGMTLIPERCIKGCFLRIRYFGVYNVTSIKKGKHTLQYKLLAHVLLHCLSMRKGTFDELRDLMRSAMVALILNKPFNFSAMIFKYMSDNITKAKDRFYMYPRFVQMLIDERLPEQANYVAPEDDAWRHADSASDSEVFSDDDDQQPPPPPPRQQTRKLPAKSSRSQQTSQAQAQGPSVTPSTLVPLQVIFLDQPREQRQQEDTSSVQVDAEEVAGEDEGEDSSNTESEVETIVQGSPVIKRLKKRAAPQQTEEAPEGKDDPSFIAEEPESSRPKKKKRMAKMPKKKKSKAPRIIVSSSVIFYSFFFICSCCYIYTSYCCVNSS